jgi:uncharacterized protein (DUF3820 family)
MDWENVICPKCGSINHYSETLTGNNNVCRCLDCGHFLGNKPRTENLNNITFPFGKYKGQHVLHCNDLNYMRWVNNNMKLTGSFKKAIEFKIGL